MSFLTLGVTLMAMFSIPVAGFAHHRPGHGDGGGGGSPSALAANVYDQVFDEQNTNEFYGGQYCLGTQNPVQNAALTGDAAVAGDTTAWGFGSLWTPASGLLSTRYENGADCGANCLRAEFNADKKIFGLDTRGTRTGGVTGAAQRQLHFDFTGACVNGECGVPGGDPNVFGGSLTVPGLLNVILDSPYDSMGICSSTTCAEAENAFAKFWFEDSSGTTWRVDWYFLRVLRMSSTTWYILADSCDGSQIAGLSKLTGNRTRPKTVFNGSYKIPFFLSIQTAP